VGTAALAEYMEPSAGHQEEPYPGALPSCMGAYEMAVLVAVGIHSELPLVSDSCESGHFHPTDHWKGGEASECFAGLQTQYDKMYTGLLGNGEILHLPCTVLTPHAEVMALSQCFSTSVRPRSGKFFFHKREPGPNKFTRKYRSNFSKFIHETNISTRGI
jgi:hypothetical protein